MKESKKEKNPLVSIIVPVYNVEKYVEQCILSLLNQTYRNIEIIAVNDGSKDESPQKILDLAKKDKRIKLLNQENKGVSATRNNGLNSADGDFIIFVDADDYLKEDFVEYMLNLINKDTADFAYSIKSFQSEKEKQTEKEIVKTVSGETSVAMLLSPDVTVGCWNKIYRKSFLKKNNLQFLTNLYYGEGLNFIIDSSLKASKVTFGNRKVYCYRKNNDSSATTKFSYDKLQNGEKALKTIEKKINLNNEYIKAMYTLHLSTFYLGTVLKLIENKQVKNYKNDYRRLRKNIKSNLSYIMKSKYVSTYRKTMLLVGTYFPHLLTFANKIRTQRIFKNSVK